jgi:hypothetical protein
VISGRVVIVGANLAGGTASAALREESFDGELVLVGEGASSPVRAGPSESSGDVPQAQQLIRMRTFPEAAGLRASC